MSILGEMSFEDAVGVGHGSMHPRRGASLLGVTPSEAVPTEYLVVELVEVHCRLPCCVVLTMEVTCCVSIFFFRFCEREAVDTVRAWLTLDLGRYVFDVTLVVVVHPQVIVVGDGTFEVAHSEGVSAGG